MPDDDILSVPEVARLAEASEREVREAIHQGVLSASKVGASYAIRSSDAQEWAEEEEAESPDIAEEAEENDPEDADDED